MDHRALADRALLFVKGKMVFVAPCLFWMTLWSIKFSLLFLYRRLLVGTPHIFNTIWWGTLVLCVLVGDYVQIGSHASLTVSNRHILVTTDSTSNLAERSLAFGLEDALETLRSALS